MDLSSACLRPLLDAMPDPVLIVEQSGEIAFAGSRLEALLGFNPNELVGQPLDMLLPERSREAHRFQLAGFFRDPSRHDMGVGLSLRCRHKDGAEIPVEVSLSPLMTNNRPMVLCAVRDVTEHQQLVKTLAAEKVLSESLIENAPAIILLLDSEGRILKINSFMEKLSGFREDEVLGKDWFTSFIPEEDRVGINELFRDVLSSGSNTGHVNPIITRNGSRRQIDWFSKKIGNSDDDSLELLNVGFDITERIERENELAEARRSAECANKSKSQFLAAASHDLRQPLQATGMYLGALSTYIHAPEQKEIVRKMRSSLDMMAELLNSLLDLSRLESGSMSAAKRDFNVQELLERVLIDNLPSAEEKGLRLCLESCDCVAHSDPALLERIVENLVTNAIRYTAEGQVTIVCRTEDEQLCIAVTDTGIGIPADARAKVFDEYVQLDGSTTDQCKGLGLGLSIVRRIASLLDHPLEVKSDLGRGSSFSIRVPHGDAEGSRVGNAVTARLPSNNNGRKPSVLLVDDDPAILDAATMLLESANITVHSAGTGERAMLLADEYTDTDIVISDYRLPDGNGIEIILRLRERFDRQLPAILMTGDTSAEEIERCALANCTVFRKPIDINQLVSLVLSSAEGSNDQLASKIKRQTSARPRLNAPLATHRLP